MSVRNESMQNELISVIIPIYNVEGYLKQCIDSVLNQTYYNLQIILVDDGSTDSSGQICDEYVMKDSRIRVIHKENGGLSDARNAGINIAEGIYIAFLDSDDWIETSMYSRLYQAIRDNNADVAYGVTQRCTRNYFENIPDGKEYVIQGGEVMDAYICAEHQPHILKAAWDKLYTREIIGETRFIKGIHGEDGPFNIEVMSRCKKVVFVGEVLHHYRDKRPGNISSVGISERLFTDRIPVARRNIDFLKNIGRNDLAERQIFFYYRELFDYYKIIGQLDAERRKDYRRRIIIQIKHDKSELIRSTKHELSNWKYKVKVIYFILCKG